MNQQLAHQAVNVILIVTLVEVFGNGRNRLYDESISILDCSTGSRHALFA